MSFCNIVGTLQDSGGQLLAGELWVQLDGSLVDVDTAPDVTLIPKLRRFTIVSGVININLHESETARVTYWIRFFAANVSNPSGLDDTASLDFHAFVPNLASVDISELVPTGITTDSLDTAIARLARLLTTNQQFVTALRGGPRYLGNYNAATYYQRDDNVSYGGSSWTYISDTPAAGQTPSTASPTYWQQAAAKGDPGGTGGNDTAYDATGWDGATDAPSRNAVRDIIELLARANNAALTGNPTATTQPIGTNNTRLATCAFAIAEIISRFTDAALLGNPTAPTQALTDSSTRISSTAFVKGVFNRYSRIADIKSAGTQGGSAAAATVQTRTLTTIVVNSGDVVNLASNTFTLRAGTYRLTASAPALQVNGHRIVLWNVTTNARAATGRNAQSVSSDSTQTDSTLRCDFTIASNTDFQIRHYTAAAVAAFGLGVALNEGGTNETYTEVEIWRLD